MRKKKLTQEKFEKILKKNSKENPFNIDNYDKQSIIACRLNAKSRLNFWIKFTCICKKSEIKNICEFSRCTMNRLTYCKSCNTKQTNLDRYGVENVYQSEKIKKKIRKTCLEKYGVEHPMFLDGTKEKIKKTFIKNYGVEHISQSEDIKEKKKQTCKKHYNVENPSQSAEIKEKKKQTCLKRYGVEHHMQNKSILNKSKETCKEKYGTEYAVQSEEVRNKIKQTCLDKYGVEYYFKSEEFINYLKALNLERYGVEYYFQSNEFRQLFKKLCLKKYGVESPFQSEKIQEKIKQTNIDRYGVENQFERKLIKDKAKQTCIERYGVDNVFKSEDIISLIKQVKLEKYGTLHIGHKYLYDDISFDSSWELSFYIFHKDKHHKIEHEPISFSYKHDNKEHLYFPDFKIGNRYYEIKGDQFIMRYKNGNIKGMICPYDHDKDDLFNAKYKCMKKHKVNVISGKEITKYLEYIEETYGSLDYLEQYRIDENKL